MLKAFDNVVMWGLETGLGKNSTLYYLSHEYWQNGIDERTNGYGFVDISNVTISLMMMTYAILVWYIIPRFMKNREPFNVKRQIIAYDFLMVAINGYFFIKSIQLADYGRELCKFEDTTGDRSERAFRYIDIANMYYISKLIDMFDTFFMAFRKRNSQISFLHVWHHVSLSYAAWLYMRYNPYTPSILLISFINSFIHMIMYGYYGCAALGPHMQKYLWWKKYITQIQLIQFVMVFLWYSMIVLKGTNLPAGYVWCNLLNAIFLFGLFFNFYIQAYRQSRKKVQ